MTSPSKRRDMDVMNLMMSDYRVETINDGLTEFNVEFHGPKESPYEGGVWKVRVELPDAYPYKSPSIGFLNKIFHPNVDELSGSICLDVINQSWSPMFAIDLSKSFKPLNGDAASLMMKDKQQYEQKVQGKSVYVLGLLFVSLCTQHVCVASTCSTCRDWKILLALQVLYTDARNSKPWRTMKVLFPVILSSIYLVVSLDLIFLFRMIIPSEIFAADSLKHMRKSGYCRECHT